jgi:hypothetical protein
MAHPNGALIVDATPLLGRGWDSPTMAGQPSENGKSGPIPRRFSAGAPLAGEPSGARFRFG